MYNKNDLQYSYIKDNKLEYTGPDPSSDPRDPDYGTEDEKPIPDSPIAWLEHSCSQWVIGGPNEVRQMIVDLQNLLMNWRNDENPDE